MKYIKGRVKIRSEASPYKKPYKKSSGQNEYGWEEEGEEDKGGGGKWRTTCQLDTVRLPVGRTGQATYDEDIRKNASSADDDTNDVTITVRLPVGRTGSSACG